MNNVTIRRQPTFKTAFTKGWEFGKDKIGFLIVSMLISGLVGNLVCGLLCPGFSCGTLALLLENMRTGRELKPTDVFNEGLKRALPAFVSALVFGILSFLLCIIIIGIPIAIFVLPGMVMYSFLVIADGANVGEAIVEPFKQLGKAQFWMFDLICIVAAIIGALGVLLCFVGLFITVPLAWCIIVTAYEEMTSAQEPAKSIPEFQAQ